MPKTLKYFLSVVLWGFFSVQAFYGQAIVEVVESVVRVGIKSEEVIYYGFAAGDKLIFSYEEENGKDMKEIEIIEMPSTSRFMDYKTTRIDKKAIEVPRTGIYKFRFNNGAFFPRVCRYKIQRIPASTETRNFNTTVYFDWYNDTTYITDMESYIEKKDTIITNLQARTVRVNPPSAPGSSKSTLNFVLPDNTLYWSYYISTDEKGEEVFTGAVKKMAADARAGIYGSPQYGPLAAVALQTESYLEKLDSGRVINYWIVEDENAELFKSGERFRFIKKGRVVNDFSMMEPREGIFYFCFHNDHKDQPVEVTVKIAAIQIDEKRGTRPVQRMIITPRNGMHLRN